MVSPARVINLLSKLRAQRKEAEDNLARIDEDLKAVERTMTLLQAEQGEESIERVAKRYLPKDFTGFSQIGAIIKLAKSNNDVVTISEAKQMLIETGLTRNPKHASQIATGTIIRSKRFEWIAPGTYRLKSIQGSDDHKQEQPNLIAIT